MRLFQHSPTKKHVPGEIGKCQNQMPHNGTCRFQVPMTSCNVEYSCPSLKDKWRQMILDGSQAVALSFHYDGAANP